MLANILGTQTGAQCIDEQTQASFETVMGTSDMAKTIGTFQLQLVNFYPS